ncbi:conserved hypothetical protein [Clostridium cavendishii DSM 21758]|uniref:tRNA-uridine aminocarboxypropyltransferase n=1 Tax=Clostridium cavendishii DSM 21758 TaxID=1121302 RepID=A0A1M6NGM1_9CLOT|nr:DTW domain-containing protein [Clostridium cavendishii]SHJ94885.1 conserved hypothetical protein [Clostridium cavendishii DSM 21758]
MSSSYKVKQITSLYNSCNECGLPIINCFCSKIEKVESKAMICILSTEKEFYRPSNTARLLKLVNPVSTKIFLWERKNKPNELLEILNNEEYEPYLLFPTEDLERKVEYKKTEKIPVFIILDGTWKEARKLFRKSDYLNNIPIVSIEPNFKSKYDLRRGVESGNLCTIEAAMEILKLNGEVNNAKVINEVYTLFLKSYKAGISGHCLKDSI